MSRKAIAVLSTENLIHNINIIKQHVPKSKIIAMIKANAYGHGLRSIAKRLENHADMVGVASIDEAEAIRAVGVKMPIVLMEGIFEPDELLVASCNKFSVVFHHQQQLEWLRHTNIPLPIKAWIKIDTGMGRLGFSLDEAKFAIEQLTQDPRILKPIGIMSHFACSEDSGSYKNKEQISNFQHFVKNFPKAELSICNSGGVFNFPELASDYVRPGLAMYGISPIAGIDAAVLNLKPVMTLQARLIAIKDFLKNSTIGYGARYVCNNKMRIGVIAIGYGDGYPRSAKDGTPLLVSGKKCQIVGRVSMDMITIDLKNCPEAKMGDVVTLWGEGLPLEEVVPFTQNSAYDILTSVQQRIKFYWTI